MEPLAEGLYLLDGFPKYGIGIYLMGDVLVDAGTKWAGGGAVVDAPGRSPGQVAYWRESDRVLILDDVLNGMNPITTAVGLHEPPELFTVDPALNRESARKLAALAPEVVCFGHGPPYRDPEGFQAFAGGLAN